MKILTTTVAGKHRPIIFTPDRLTTIQITEALRIAGMQVFDTASTPPWLALSLFQAANNPNSAIVVTRPRLNDVPWRSNAFSLAIYVKAPPKAGKHQQETALRYDCLFHVDPRTPVWDASIEDLYAPEEAKAAHDKAMARLKAMGIQVKIPPGAGEPTPTAASLITLLEELS